MYVQPAKTRVSLCIDQLHKASFLDSTESIGTYFTISEGSDQNVLLKLLCLSRFRSRLSKVDKISECAYQNVQLRRPESSLVAQDVLLNPEIVGGTYD